MNKDELERFVENNRGEFDSVEEFNQELVWAKIESKTQYNNSIWKIIAICSICLLIGLASLYTYTIYNQNSNFETLAGLTNEQESKRDEMIKFVSAKEQQVREKNINLDEFGDFKRELDGLDEIEKIVIGDFSKSVNKEKMVKSMLQYYESKARILELILMETEKKKENETFDKKIY